jgi:hypothetical protein
MPRYMLQATYTPAALAALTKNPENRAEQAGALLEKVGGRLLTFDHKEVCSACGAVTGGGEGVPYVQQEDARFCTSCWRGLTPVQVERVGREVALRGVPL